MPKGAFTRPVYLGHCLIDDNGGCRSGTVAFVECSAVDQPYAHNSEIPCSDKLPVIDVLNRSSGLRNESFDLRVIRVDRTEWRQAGNRSNILDTRQATNSVLNRHPELSCGLALTVSGRGQWNLQCQDSVGVEACVHCQQLPKRANHETISNQQQERHGKLC